MPTFFPSSAARPNQWSTCCSRQWQTGYLATASTKPIGVLSDPRTPIEVSTILRYRGCAFLTFLPGKCPWRVLENLTNTRDMPNSSIWRGSLAGRAWTPTGAASWKMMPMEYHTKPTMTPTSCASANPTTKIFGLCFTSGVSTRRIPMHWQLILPRRESLHHWKSVINCFATKL